MVALPAFEAGVVGGRNSGWASSCATFSEPFLGIESSNLAFDNHLFTDDALRCLKAKLMIVLWSVTSLCIEKRRVKSDGTDPPSSSDE